MTAVKICGLTRVEDVAEACALGAEYVGFNFAAGSRRRVTLEAAPGLAEAARGALRVGVFVDETRDEIAAAAVAARLDLLQIHRALRDEDLGLPLPVIAVVSVGGSGGAPALGPLLARCHAILFDSSAPREAPERSPFDWGVLESTWPSCPLMLGGGLTPDNVAEAIRRVRPAVVDVASGIETSHGVKDHAKMRRFFAAVREADGR